MGCGRVSSHLCEINGCGGTTEVGEDGHVVGLLELGLDREAKVDEHWGVGGGGAI